MENLAIEMTLRNILWISLLSIVTLGCEKEQIVRPLPAKRKKQPLATVHGFEYLYTENGLKRAYLKAPLYREFFEKGNEQITWAELKKGFILFFYDSLGTKMTSSVRADYGKLYDKRNKAYAKGNVVVTSSDGKKLETETLHWNRKKDRLYTDDFVKITTPKEIIEGYGMEANTSFSWYKIYKIRGIFEVENENQISAR